MNLPTLSVLMTSYNQGRYIPGALQAILEQSVQPKQVIVIDDCSTDDSIKIIESFAEKYPIMRLVRNDRNRGLIFTAMRGREYLTGDYCHFTNPDDPVFPGLYEKSLMLLSQHPRAGLCSTICRNVDEKGNELDLIPIPPYVSKLPCYLSPDESLEALLEFGSWYAATTAIWKRETLLELGGIPFAELRSFSDSVMFYQIALKYGICFIPELLGTWTVATSGFSAKSRQDPQVCLDLVSRAEKFMTETFPDRFPEKFVKDFKRRSMATFGNVVLGMKQISQKERFEYLKLALPTVSIADRLLFFLSAEFIPIPNFLIKIYLAFRLKRFDRVLFLRLLYLVKCRLKTLLK